MLKPIGFEVIRQALDWHDFPLPLLRQLSFYEWDDKFSAEYRAQWEFEQLGERHWFTTGSGEFALSPSFASDLAMCFARDISVIDVQVQSAKHRVVALLHVSLSKEPVQLMLLDEG